MAKAMLLKSRNRLRVVALATGRGRRPRSKSLTLLTNWTPAQFVRFLSRALEHAGDEPAGRNASR